MDGIYETGMAGLKDLKDNIKTGASEEDALPIYINGLLNCDLDVNDMIVIYQDQVYQFW